MLEINQLYNVDCLEGMKEIDDRSIHLIVPDLPYGQKSRNSWDSVIPFNDYVLMDNRVIYEKDVWKVCLKLGKSIQEGLDWFHKNKEPGLWTHYERIIKDNGAIILFANGMFTADLMQSNRKLWRYNLIWEKTQPTGFYNAKKMPLRSHEDICIFYKNPPTYNPQKTTGHARKVSKAEHKVNCKQSTDYGLSGFTTYDSTERYPKSVWTFAKDIQKSALHPTQKPVALIEELIKTYTNEGDLILDNTAGSMTTAVAAINTNRNYICMEKDKEIFEIGRDRVMTHIGN